MWEQFVEWAQQNPLLLLGLATVGMTVGVMAIFASLYLIVLKPPNKDVPPTESGE